jgi:uncharacterized protein YigA (DUF484 family)
MIPRNALESWKLAAPNAEVILFGDEEGAAEAAQEAGARHVANVERADAGQKYCGRFLMRRRRWRGSSQINTEQDR